MRRIGRQLAMGLVIAAGALAAPPDTQPASYREDFEHLAAAKLPDGFQVMAGEFVLGVDAGNHFLELPGDPLDTFGLLFGPPNQAQADVSARIWGAATGKRFPEFGIGCCDVSAYKLWAIPGQHVLELRKGDDTRASAAFIWKSETWTHLRLRVTHEKSPHGYRVEGKSWADGESEPVQWNVAFDDSEDAPAGRASLWGEPFSEKPIRFDDLVVQPPR